MGGGHTYYIPPKTASDAESAFKGALDEFKQATTEQPKCNVFISFAVEDEPQVNFLRSQAKNPDYELNMRDYSVKEPIEERWKSAVRERISQTSATIVMISENSARSDAVNWEIEETYRQGKKVIGVRVYRDRNDPVPQALRDHNAPVINWDLAEIKRILESS